MRVTTAGTEPPEARLARTFGALLPAPLARLAGFELVLASTALRFVFGGWRRPVPPGFTYHRECALRFVLALLPLLALGDFLLLELVLLPNVETWLRIGLHALAIYGLVWLLGFYASVRVRPHQLVDGLLTLHRGMLSRVDVPVDQIASIEPLPSFADDWKQRAYCKGAIRMDVAGPTILELRLHTAVRPTGVFGVGRSSVRVLVAVDDPMSLTAALR
jgi:hypothetical protein